MNCKQIREQLSPYLDQFLSQEDMSLVERHLEKCSMCRRELEDLQETLNIIHTLPDIPLPADFQQELRNKLTTVKEEGKRQRKAGWLNSFRSFRYSWASLSMAAVLLIFLYAIISPMLPKMMVQSDIPYGNASHNQKQSESLGGGSFEAADSQLPDTADEIQTDMLLDQTDYENEEKEKKIENDTQEISLDRGDNNEITITTIEENSHDADSLETNSLKGNNEVRDKEIQEVKEEPNEHLRIKITDREETKAPVYSMIAVPPEENLNLAEKRPTGQVIQLNIINNEYEKVFNRITNLSGEIPGVISVDNNKTRGEKDDSFVITVAKGAMPKVISELNTIEKSVREMVYDDGGVLPEKMEYVTISIVVKEIDN